MPEHIPGEEFAPAVVVGHMDADGYFYRTPPEGGPQTCPIKARLNVRDPDDRRAIWRMAALALGIDAEGSDTSTVVVDAGGEDVWALVAWIYGYGDFCLAARIILRDIKGATIAHATAALCAEVWGPKGAS